MFMVPILPVIPCETSMAEAYEASDQQLKFSHFHVDISWMAMPSLHGNPCEESMEGAGALGGAGIAKEAREC